MSGPDAALLSTLAYHDLFEFPLTAHEAHQCTPGEEPFEATWVRLERLRAEGRIDCRAGLWHLAGRGAIVATRLARYDLAASKYRRVARFFRIARFFPFIRAAFVCNTLARSNAKGESDIDLFVVAGAGRIWTARFFLASFAALLGLRPEPGRTADRLCLSFFADECALDLSPLAIGGDAYLPRWIHELAPIYDGGGWTARVAEANRALVAAVGRPIAALPSHRRSVRSASSFQRIIERWCGPRLEARLKKLQLGWLPARLRPSSGEAGVVVSDLILKFHDGDRRALIRDRHAAALRALQPDVSAEPAHDAEPLFQMA